MNWNAKWIRPAKDTGDAAPIYLKDFSLTGTVKKATMAVTALGVYEAMLNQKRVGTFILARAGLLITNGFNTRNTMSRIFWLSRTSSPSPSERAGTAVPCLAFQLRLPGSTDETASRASCPAYN